MKKNVIILSALLSSGIAFSQVGINTPDPKAALDIVGSTLGIKMSAGSGSWDNIWLNINSRKATVNASGAEDGLQFNVGNNGKGTYGDNDQVLTTVATMTSTGNMGIGTTIPKSLLDLGSGTGSSTSDPAGKKLAVYNNSDGTSFYGLGVSGNTLQMHAGSAQDADPSMVLTKNGNVGIGTASPTGKMEIISDNEGSGAGNDIYFRGFGNSVGTGIFLSSARGNAGAPENLQDGDNISGFYFTPRYNNTYATSTSGIQAFYKGDGTTNLTDMRFIASGSERIRIAENGNIGIGTTTPQKKLHIGGSLQITNELNVGGNGSTAGSAGSVGQVLTSKGPGQAPSWEAPNIGSNVFMQSFQLKIPPHNQSRADFTNHSVTTYDSDNWWVISKNSVNPAANIPARMTIVYEYQGPAFPDLDKIFPQLTAGNNRPEPDVFSPSFIQLQNVGGKTRLIVSVSRTDNLQFQWAGTFLLNTLLAIKY